MKILINLDVPWIDCVNMSWSASIIISGLFLFISLRAQLLRLFRGCDSIILRIKSVKRELPGLQRCEGLIYLESFWYNNLQHSEIIIYFKGNYG